MEPRSRNLSDILRDEMAMRDRIEALLADAPRTIPEIARDLPAPEREVTLWVMAMRRYGRIEEIPKAKADDYYRYRNAQAPKEAPGAPGPDRSEGGAA